jgi:hypothetical protein
VDDLRDHRERFDGALAETRDEEKLFEVGRAAIGGGAKARVKTTEDDVGAPDVVVGRHLQPRERLLSGLPLGHCRRAGARHGVHDDVGAAFHELELRGA